STEGNLKARAFSGFSVHALHPRRSSSGYSSPDEASALKKSLFSDKGPVRPDASQRAVDI
ncbi:MAG: hypothetical protein LBU32_12435, partial [Clostridiales bacterium]|nr:hypothetical protein [Clostridiales bacterium]